MSAPAALSPRAAAELGLLALIWGGSFFSIAVALREIGPLTAVLHRVFWAALLLWAVALARGATIPRAPKLWGAFAVMGLLNNVAPFSLMAWGQTQIETGLVSILNASTAIFAALVAAALLPSERLTARRALGVALGFSGVVAMIGAEALGGVDLRSLAQGAVALGALSYAFASVWAKLRLGGVAPEVAAAGMLTCSAAIMVGPVLALEGAPSLALSAQSWAAIGWFAAVGTAGAYLLYFRVLAMAGAANLMLVTLLIPPVAIALGAAFLGERVGPEAALGYALLALGLAVIDGRALGRRRVA
ncbi:MAG: DMT family transporter [Rubrimonas sp.]|uniref:DMT family transporter n=1 Tax=Rubrimonas sp. TaxID=2036015 RepID=UPI002FDD1240